MIDFFITLNFSWLTPILSQTKVAPATLSLYAEAALAAITVQDLLKWGLFISVYKTGKAEKLLPVFVGFLRVF